MSNALLPDERTSELSSAFTIGRWMAYVDQAGTKKKRIQFPLSDSGEERSSKGISLSWEEKSPNDNEALFAFIS